ncbi:MAG: hypothetical protein RJA61_369 [Candidatus Parcubacteria bacterium]|jgi:hypothetical protein
MAQWMDIGVYNKDRNTIEVWEYAVPDEDIDILHQEGFMLPSSNVLKDMLIRIGQHVCTTSEKEVWMLNSWCCNYSPYSIYGCPVRKGKVVQVIVIPRPIFPPQGFLST